MKLLIDTNIWIRYIIKDNDRQFAQAKELFAAIDAGVVKAYGSSVVFLEVNYVLKSIYHFKFEEILEVMSSMRNLRDVAILEEVNIDIALKYFKTYRVKFSDCLIASQLREDIVLATFDREMGKIKEVTTKTPSEILAQLKKLN